MSDRLDYVTHFWLEDVLPESGSAEDVAKGLCENPEFVAAIQEGIDRHQPDTPGGMGFKRSIAARLAECESPQAEQDSPAK